MEDDLKLLIAEIDVTADAILDRVRKENLKEFLFESEFSQKITKTNISL